MKPMSNFEKKFGKYAIKNISLVLILFYACGYLINWINPVMFNYLTLNPYAILFKGQIWRLITWLIIPPENFSFFTLIMLYFYYSIGTTLERTWGTYRYNLYLFLGIIFTAVGAFAMMGFVYLFQRDILFAMGAENYFAVLSTMFSTYYVNMSIFLAFAATFPDMQVLLFFFIPIKVKILGIIYGVLLVYEFIAGVGNKYLNAANRFVIGASLLNFIVFFLTSRNMIHMSPKQVKRRQEFKREVKQSAKITRHKCAICGRTEETNPELEFRFCSKCDGNYEYCQDHLFTHAHVKYQGDHK
ncbi:MAG: rhomboid family intramembrane serine protease [Lachnospiraceae bacterium]|nr:rhomboid family intramembrane serine protease [Lachnospiraceae bacterium]MCI7191073.1 rhomboid family intramembrane serine protease [Lachnospiraceae bacterium]MDD7626643.1 hypothetical protein [Lachnospiraceae bacterium]MDY4117857.1 hypothetical protein [Lachnospiraceae bacterium]